MLKNITLGTYYPGESVLHQLRARTKLLLVAWLVLWLLVANQRVGHFVPYALISVLVVVAARLSNVRLGYLWQRLRFVVGIAIFSAVFSLIGGSGPIFYTTGTLRIGYPLLHWGALALAVVAVGCVAATVSPWRLGGRWWARHRFLRFLLLPTALALGLLFVLTGGAPGATLQVGPFAVALESVWLVTSVILILVVLFTLSTLIMMTTPPIALIEGMTILMKPLRRLHLPVDDFALMTLLALRFIPTMVDEVDQLINAQAARGADMLHGEPRERLRSAVALIVPLMQSTFRRAADLATALESRGYDIEERRTLLHEGAFGALDYAVLAAVIVVTMGSLVF